MSDELQLLIEGGEQAVGELFSRYRDRFERMIDFRMDDRVRGRIDPEDVLQEAFIEVARRIPEYIARHEVSFFVWARQITWQILIGMQRRHFGQKRDPRREHEAHSPARHDATSHSIAAAFFAQLTTPSQAAMKREEIEQLRAVLDSMDEMDREVLALRHFEHLGNNQVAEVLGLSVTAASNRYIRAMTRLSEIMQRLNASQESAE